MIISDLNYLESAIEANNLEGGADAAVSLTAFLQQARALQSAAQSGPNGSLAGSSGVNLDIRTFGFNTIVLGI